MKTRIRVIKGLLISLTILFSLNAFALEPAVPQQPVPLNPTRLPGWDLLGTDGEGSRWFLYKEIKGSVGSRVYRVQVDMFPSENNQKYKDAGGIGNRYFIDVDCAQRTMLFVEFTAQKKDGTSERYVYPGTTAPARPGATSLMAGMIDKVCIDR